MELDINRRFADARQMQAALRQASGTLPYPVAQPQPGWASASGGVGAGVQPRPVSLPRDARWPLEMATGTAMALVGVLALQVLLFAPWMTTGLYFGRSLSAVLLGALGWFIGDLIFQALAKPGSTAVPAPSHRPTQRLAAFTRQFVRRLTLGQRIALLGSLLAVVVLLAWLLAPAVARMPFVINYVSFYAPIAPLVYAAVGRRPGWAGLAHFLTLTLGAVAAWMRTPADTSLGALALAALLSGLLIEGTAFLGERMVIK